MRYEYNSTRLPESRQPQEYKSVPQIERQRLDMLVALLSLHRSTEAIFYLANGLYDVGMDRVIEDES